MAFSIGPRMAREQSRGAGGSVLEEIYRSPAIFATSLAVAPGPGRDGKHRNAELRAAVGDQPNRLRAAAFDGAAGNACTSVGFQSNARAGTFNASGASSGQSQCAGIAPRSTSMSAPPRCGALSKAYCHSRVRQRRVRVLVGNRQGEQQRTVRHARVGEPPLLEPRGVASFGPILVRTAAGYSVSMPRATRTDIGKVSSTTVALGPRPLDAHKALGVRQLARRRRR